MKILSIRPAPPGSGSLRARVDFELPGGLRLFNVAIKETPSGWRAFAPSAFGSATATFTSALAAEMVAVARNEIGEIDRGNSRAA